MTKKIYGVFGLIEYVLQLNIGGKIVTCPFKDGSITALGVVPATYETNSPVLQYAIEQSHAYQSGRVKIVRTIQQQPVMPKSVSVKKVDTKIQPKGLKVVEVSCIEDAVEHLKQYGYKSHDLLTKTSIEAAAKKQGIEFKITTEQ